MNRHDGFVDGFLFALTIIGVAALLGMGAVLAVAVVDAISRSH